MIMLKHDLPALSDPELARASAFIDGAWVEAAGVGNSGCNSDGNAAGATATFAVHDPATGKLLAQVANLGAADAQRAIDAAAAALPLWRARLPKERAALLRKWFDLIIAHQEDLARLMTAEQGKPLVEARGEVLYGASFVEWFAEEAKRVAGDVLVPVARDKRQIVLKEPIGVCAAITPWNFPMAMVTRKVAPALAAGCTIVLKPAEQTPLSALALAELAQRAGFPKGVFNVVTADAARSIDIGKVLCDSPVVRKLTFTGSTAVGRILMQQCAPTIKKLSLELGGHAPFIVFEDADLERAVEGAVQSKYRNAGQTCVCANRFYVHEKLHDAFVEKFAAAAAKVRVGNGFEAGIQQGPLIDDAALAKVEEHVGNALAGGARAVTGGQRHALGGRFFEPTVLAGVTADMLVVREETFGPVAPVISFSDERDVIRQANHTEYGLAAYFYARDIGRVWRVAEALEYGMVGINTGVFTNEIAPFGGVKQSGLGREGSKYGIDEFLEIKYVCMGGV